MLRHVSKMEHYFKIMQPPVLALLALLFFRAPLNIRGLRWWGWLWTLNLGAVLCGVVAEEFRKHIAHEQANRNSSTLLGLNDGLFFTTGLLLFIQATGTGYMIYLCYRQGLAPALKGMWRFLSFGLLILVLLVYRAVTLGEDAERMLEIVRAGPGAFAYIDSALSFGALIFLSLVLWRTEPPDNAMKTCSAALFAFGLVQLLTFVDIPSPALIGWGASFACKSTVLVGMMLVHMSQERAAERKIRELEEQELVIAREKQVNDLASRQIKHLYHDVITPFNTINGMLNLLHADIREDPMPKIEVALETNARLGAMFDAILDEQLIRFGEEETERIFDFKKDRTRLTEDEAPGAHNLATLMEAAVFAVKFRAKSEMKIVPAYGAKAEIIARKTDVVRILINLIHNAYDARYTDADIERLRDQGLWMDTGYQHCKIRIAIRRKVDLYEVQIVDNGKGIDESIRDRIYEDGVTGHEDKDGRGHGLAIVKELVERNGGTVTHISPNQYQPGRTGATAIVTFPTPEIGV